ncbi:mannose-1-phosphate guanylyltransferase/mannose-6-phosphate isomerase [Vibrio parahaemolyticus]|uniref:mannose-1-phosphate guanylyltransferase/mannose-6-phosphate isomerase n=1 Tax=Vibrio parahaemolyticus TaxID=670 RepID=UPI0003F6FE7A|nr:mannose-1-phosphate guanylyltransferase/mannose-6-phosphate isomerase [Vibrio parahaemolyticus]EGQ8416656.1 mannose-1-phosphate guanylyltransferase/mannose-6-phosphate isomerase [Vibrio parahaemolyticus]EGQ9447514.1 mannose-1-phosphate guanylyltransferase/mannose-6-phosphate isomerase [Vibrio parahaemolyticus]EGQ9533352.1 mannose-1-phosphate guanylyltransferase/mannose-6-phosphate isomerase [Vibrio parahaemolyticus]EGR3035233.1 mannose-1-phosphate guanylyltransferase/mannose-6-phosphate isom
MPNILPVIMAGGCGSRLWPMSRTHYPKQFLSLTSDSSMLQDTILRLKDIEHEPISLICNEEHRFLAAEQLRSRNISHSGIILEPFGRNTAPAVALSALRAIEEGQDPILLVLAADHLIKDDNVFRKTVEAATSLAESGKLVTFGIVPTKPETGYGYIRCGNKLPQHDAFSVDAFVEKPNLSVAKQYFNDGDYYWNSGMFMFKASRYLKELEKFRPDILDAVNSAYSGAHNDLDFIRLDEKAFKSCPDESIDYAVMEKTSDAVVCPLDAGWSDVGAWSSLWEVSEQDERNNVIRGDVLVDNSQRCYINSSNRLIAAVGVEDLVIVDTKDALLVAHRDKVQDVKNIVSSLKQKERSEFQRHREVYRPWGMHDHIAEGERYNVKKVVVKPGHKTAMQLHYHRAEHWVVVSGTAVVYRGTDKHIVTENESIYIPVGTEHCFENPGKFPLEIIEVRTGGYLSEDDIVRTDSKSEGY